MEHIGDFLSPRARRSLETLVEQANKQFPTAIDLDRWRDFVIDCFLAKGAVPEELLRTHLVKNGFRFEVAVDLVRDFARGLDLLHAFERRTIT